MRKDIFSFDERVARRYNTQRAHAPEVSQKIGEAIVHYAGTGANVLEIGIGTGRIAWPVVDAGCRVVGFDLSSNMLEEVFSQRQHDHLAVAQANMQHMPFKNDSFQAVLAVHVLHLAKDWRGVLHEIARVLDSGGAFIQGDDWMDPESIVGKLRDELRAYVIRTAPHMKPPSAGVSKEQVLADLGGTEVEEMIAAEWTMQMSPAERLEDYEHRLDAESWFLPPQMFEPAIQHLREYAESLWPDLEAKQTVTRRFILKVTRGKW